MVHLRANDVIREARLDRYVSILSLFLNILFFSTLSCYGFGLRFCEGRRVGATRIVTFHMSLSGDAVRTSAVSKAESFEPYEQVEKQLI